MELKKQLLGWYNEQLQNKGMFIKDSKELASGYYFLQLLHSFHPKTVTLSKVYLHPNNQYQTLQNYKHLCQCFIRLGWKKLDPQKLAKGHEKDYLSLAHILKKILSEPSIKDSVARSNIDTTLQQFEGEEKLQLLEEGTAQKRRLRIAGLQKIKADLMGKIQAIHMQLLKADQTSSQSEEQAIAQLRKKIIQVLDGYSAPS